MKFIVSQGLSRKEENIKINLRKSGHKDKNWIEMAHDRFQ